MARISSYQNDTSVESGDRLIGTDAAGNSTKNYPISSISKFFNENNSITIGGQLVFYFEMVPADATQGDFYVNNGNVEPDLSAVTKFTVSKYYRNSLILDEMLEYIASSKFLLVSLDDQNIKAEYTVLSYADNADPAFIDITVLPTVPSGTLVNNSYYMFSKAVTVEADAHYVHQQAAASTVWNVTHNLDKKPSVSIVDSGDTKINGQVDYIDANTLRITLSAPTSGKAYIN